MTPHMIDKERKVDFEVVMAYTLAEGLKLATIQAVPPLCVIVTIDFKSRSFAIVHAA